METLEYPPTRAPLRRPVRPIPVPPPPKPRIGNMIGWVFISFAIFVDVVEMVLSWLGIGLIASTLISTCVTLVFWIGFKLCGVEFTGKPKNLGSFAGMAFLEVIPGLDALILPAWTIGIWALVGRTMEEDGQSGIIVTVYQNTLKYIGL